MCGLLGGWFGRGRILIPFYATFRPLFRLGGRWSASIPSEAVSYSGNPLTNKARSRNVEGMVNRALDAVCELIGFSLRQDQQAGDESP
jgi:hypothetical protein